MILYRYYLLYLTGFFLVLCSTASIAEKYGHETTFFLNAGYRNDHLDWNIAGTIFGTSPNIISELTWSNLRIYELATGLEYRSGESVFSISYSRGIIKSGLNQDSDYQGDNKTLEWSRSNNSSDGDRVVDYEFGIGHRYDIRTSRPGKLIYVTPMLGYSYREQSLEMTNGLQTVSIPANAPPGILPLPVGPFPGLNSTFRAEWEGLWFGVQLLFMQISSSENILFFYKHHWPDYYGEANWNLQSNFEHPVSFEHHADGDGNEFILQWIKSFTGNWDMTVGLHAQKFTASPGMITFNLSGGGIAVQRLNASTWQSTAIMAGLRYRL